jgi:hypothetical protein
MVTSALGSGSAPLSGTRGGRSQKRGGTSRRRVTPCRVPVSASASSDVAVPVPAADVAHDPGGPSPSSRALVLPRCVGTVRRVDTRGNRFEFYVVGTVHVPGCASAAEVTDVIQTVRPHAVVLELCQERLDISLANALAATSPGYGADFLAGAVAAEKLGALVVLGDAKVRSLPELARARVFANPAELLDVPRLWRSLVYLAQALGFGEEEEGKNDPHSDTNNKLGYKKVQFAQVLAADPGKLRPLASPAFAAAAAAAAVPQTLNVTPLASAQLAATAFGSRMQPSWADLVVTAVALLIAGRATEVLLDDRDDLLAGSAARAAAMISGLESKTLQRVSHSFTADADETRDLANEASTHRTLASTDTSSSCDARVSAGKDAQHSLPCFTLRRPLKAGETRTLNLFEPRWLAMIDAAVAANGGDPVGVTIACGLAVNRRYVDDAWLRGVRSGRDGMQMDVDRGVDSSMDSGMDSAEDSSDNSSSKEMRDEYDQNSRNADLVVERWARVARVTSVTEGRRTVTGARKLSVSLEGSEDLRQVKKFSAHLAGYMVATLMEANEAQTFDEVEEVDGKKKAKTTRVVCVVGLAHCNGVLSRLATADVEAYR